MAASPLKAHSLGSYQVLRKLGSGGMAEVFLAAHHMAGDVERLVVIKAMLSHLADDDRFKQMFLREARITALLSHPNVVQIHDVSVIEGRPCIVMEFLRGRDLWHVLRRMARRSERIRPEAAAAVVAQAASGLDYAHHKRDDRGQRLDLVHRDISPHNLFLTRDGRVRVLDFGIAKSRYQQQRTQSGVLKGKLPYMAPEQARGKEVDGRTDEFALGVILWEMLTGRRERARAARPAPAGPRRAPPAPRAHATAGAHAHDAPAPARGRAGPRLPVRSLLPLLLLACAACESEPGRSAPAPGFARDEAVLCGPGTGSIDVVTRGGGTLTIEIVDGCGRAIAACESPDLYAPNAQTSVRLAGSDVLVEGCAATAVGGDRLRATFVPASGGAPEVYEVVLRGDCLGDPVPAGGCTADAGAATDAGR